MQAYRAAAVIEKDHGLRLTDLPFQPGSSVEVIVLVGPSGSEATPSSEGKGRRLLELAGSWADMPEDTYRGLMEEIEERRQLSGSGARRGAAGLD